MTLYYGPEKLEQLLEDLFADDEILEDIVVLGKPVLFTLSPNCCSISYTSYSD